MAHDGLGKATEKDHGAIPATIDVSPTRMDAARARSFAPPGTGGATDE